MISHITIVGVGLIGGSLAKVWKSKRPDLVITGYDRRGVLHEALERGILDRGSDRLDEALEQADLAVLATPVASIPGLLREVAPLLPDGCLVTDVGSVKGPIVTAARETFGAGQVFIGGHPMAGSEHSGVAHADALLFENATYVLCPPASESPEAFARRYPDFVSMIEMTGANVLVLDAVRHDEIAAAVSHVPQLVAVALMNLAAGANQADSAFLRLAAGGFRDMTRIAASSYEVWEDILSANRFPIRTALERLVDNLKLSADRLSKGETAPFADEFRGAREARRSIPRDMKGFVHPLSDIYVYAVDRPGFLFHLTHILFETGLNIKDIELLKMREGTGGAFRLGFESDAAANAAVETLTRNGYVAYRL